MIRKCLAPLLIVFAFGAVANGDDTLLLDPDVARLMREPDIAIAETGSAVVVWSSRVSKGAQPLNGIRIRRFDKDAAAVGEVFRIDVLPGDLARKPAVDMTPDGSRFVVAWEGGSDGKRTKRRIWARIFDSAGEPLGVDIRVDQRKMTHERWGLRRDYYLDPKISIAPNGEFVVVWRSEGQTSCDRFNISARRFSPVGVPLGDEFIVNSELPWSQVNPDVDHDASGGFVVVWQDGRFFGTDREWSSIHGRVFAAGTGGGGDEFILSPPDGEMATMPSLAVAPDGSFACAWKAGNRDDPLSHVRAGAYYSNGALVGSVVDIVPEKPGKGSPNLVLVGRAEFMVAWAGVADDRFGSPAVVAQIFNLAGIPTSEFFALSPATCWGVSTPEVAASGDFAAVVWKSPLDDGVMVRRFSSSSPKTDAPLNGGGRGFQELVATGRQILTDPDAESSVRTGAASFLSCMRGVARSAVGDFQRCLSDDKGDLRKAACCFGLASVAESSEQALGSLLAVLASEEDDTTRAAAACAVGWLGEDAISAAPMLVSALEDDSASVRGCAGKSLGQIGAYGSVESIVAALRNGDSSPFGIELHQRLIRGLGEFANDERVRRAMMDYAGACNGLRAWVDDGRVRADLQGSNGLANYIKYRARGRRVHDSEEVNRMIEDARYRLDEGRVGTYKSGPGSALRRYFKRIDRMIRKFVGIRDLGPMRPCDCVMAMALGLSDLDPLPDWAANIYSSELRAAVSSPCLQDLLAVVRRLGTRAAQTAPALVGLLAQEEAPVVVVIGVLASTDPGCKVCLRIFGDLLNDQSSKVRGASIRALIEAGPEAIWASRLKLTELLDDESSQVREGAEKALDLIEVEAEACKETWLPIDNPELEPPPPPRSAAPRGIGRAPSGRSAMPPRPVRTLPPESTSPPRSVQTPLPGSAVPPGAVGTPPVAGAGYTGRPKKPD